MDSPTAIRGQVRFLAVMAGCNVLLPYLGLTEFLLMTVFSGMVAGQGAVAALGVPTCLWLAD